MWENLDVILIFSENEMSTWEDLVVNEPHLSSLPPALASSLVKELQETRGVAKVKLQNEMPCFFPRHSFKWQNRMTLPLQSPGQEPSKKGSYLSSIRRRRWLHWFFKVIFIFKVIAPIPLFYSVYFQDCYAVSSKVIFLLQGGCTDPFSVFTFLAFALAVMDLVMEMNRCVCFCAIKHSSYHRIS